MLSIDHLKRKKTKPYPGRKKAVLIKQVPVNVWAQYKAWCARRGVSMQSHLVWLLRLTIRDDNHADARINKRGGKYDVR